MNETIVLELFERMLWKRSTVNADKSFTVNHRYFLAAGALRVEDIELFRWQRSTGHPRTAAPAPPSSVPTTFVLMMMKEVPCKLAVQPKKAHRRLRPSCPTSGAATEEGGHQTRDAKNLQFGQH